MFCGAHGPNSYTLIPEALILSEVAVRPNTVILDQINEKFSFVFTFENERRPQTFSCSFEEVIVVKASTIEPYLHVFSLKLKLSASRRLYDIVSCKTNEAAGFYPDIILTLCLSENAFDIFVGICQQSLLYCDVTDAHLFLTSLGNLYSLLLYKKDDSEEVDETSDEDCPPEHLECSLAIKSNNSCENKMREASPNSPVKLGGTSSCSSPTSSCSPEASQMNMISPSVELDENDESAKCSSISSSYGTRSDVRECPEDIDIDQNDQEFDENSSVKENQELETVPTPEEETTNNKTNYNIPSPARLIQSTPAPVSNGSLLEPIVIEELSSDDDEDVGQPRGDLRLKFVDGSIFIFPRESFEKNISPNSWLNDIMIDFFMDWVTKECLTEEDRRDVHIFHTTFFTKLLRLKKSIGIPSNGTKAQIDQHMNYLFNRLYPFRKNQLNIDYIRKDLLIVPVFWENHWLLAMIHGVRNLLNDNADERCRIIIVDSKMNDPLNAQILPAIHQQIFELLRGYVQLIVYTQFQTMFSSKFTFIRCFNLPDQKNSYDCGLFLVRYVKIFSKRREFMKMKDDMVAAIQLPQSNISFQLKIDQDRLHMKQLIENYLVR